MARPEARTEVLTESDYPDWNRLVASSASGSAYALPAYLDALCTAGGGRFRIIGVRQGDQLLGGVGLHERDGAFGRYVSPRLLLYYNGPVLREHESSYPSERTARDLKVLTALEHWMAKEGFGSVALKSRAPLTDVRPFLTRGWTARHGYTYVVSITDLALTRARIEQNLRRLIDRCGRAEIALSEDDDFDSFFRLHSLTMERVNARVYLPAPAFRRYHDTLARQGLLKLFHVRLPTGEAIASQLVLLGHAVTHTLCAGADPQHLKTGVTPYLRWKVFERLAALGHSANDLTDASLNPVTHFKSQLGGTLEALVELRSPESTRFRIGNGMWRAAERSRAAAGAIVRRAFSRAGSSTNGESND